jgi:hypothetical protein
MEPTYLSNTAPMPLWKTRGGFGAQPLEGEIIPILSFTHHSLLVTHNSAANTLNCRRDPHRRGNQAEEPRKIRHFGSIVAAKRR